MDSVVNLSIVSRIVLCGARSKNLPRGLRASCYRKFKRWNKYKKIRVRTKDGVDLIVCITDDVDNKLAVYREFEPHITKLVKALVAERAGFFLDVGCHLGYYSTLVGVYSPEMEIVSVDANPVMAGRCKRNLELNHISPRVLNAGVGLERGQMVFNYSRDSPSLGTFGELPSYAGHGEEVEVEVIPFSEIIDSIDGEIQLLKMDIEGFEYLALSSLSQTQAYRINNMIVEFSDERFEQCGFSTTDFQSLEWIQGFDIYQILADSNLKQIGSLLDIDSGDQNILLKRRL